MAQANKQGPLPQPVLRVEQQLNHHLSRLGGIWYVRLLAFPTPHTPVTVRRSLKTCDVVIARRRRDQLLRQLSFAGGAE